MKKVIVSLLFLFIIIFFFSCHKKILPSSVITINFVGDIIPHKVIKYVPKNKNNLTVYSKRYRYVHSYLQNANLSVCNLETPIADTNLKRVSPIIFDAPLQFAQALHFAPFQLIHIANNHALDCGSTGFNQTVRRLHKDNFKVLGYSVHNQIQTLIYETNNIKIGFISATKLLNLAPDKNTSHTNVVFYNTNLIFPEIRHLKKSVDYVIFMIHWGKEYITNQPKLYKNAKKIFLSGADAIIGHHPHILLPIETMKIKNKTHFVAYSIGNFLSNQGRKFPIDTSEKSEQTRQSIILQLHIKKINAITQLDTIQIIPVWIVNNYLQVKNKKEKLRKIFPFPINFQNTNILSFKFQKKEKQKIAQALKLHTFNTNLVPLKY